MTAQEILAGCRCDGIALTLVDGGIKFAGGNIALACWLPHLRQHKEEVVKAMLERDAAAGDLADIKRWLAYIGEHDPGIIGEVLDRCRNDPEANAYFNGRAAELTDTKGTKGTRHLNLLKPSSGICG